MGREVGGILKGRAVTVSEITGKMEEDGQRGQERVERKW